MWARGEGIFGGREGKSVCSLRAQSPQSRHGCTMIRVLWPILVWASAAAGPAGYPGLRCSFEDLCAWRWNTSDWEVSGVGAPPGNYSLAPSVDADDSSSGRSALSIHSLPLITSVKVTRPSSSVSTLSLTEINKLTWPLLNIAIIVYQKRTKHDKNLAAPFLTLKLTSDSSKTQIEEI